MDRENLICAKYNVGRFFMGLLVGKGQAGIGGDEEASGD
jgi:hypothetical protein